MRFSRILAVVLGILVPIAETVRRWSTWQEAPLGSCQVVTGTLGTRKAFVGLDLKNPFKYEPPPPTPTGLSVATFKVAEK